MSSYLSNTLTFTSSLSGVFKDDALNGKGVYTYEDGSCLGNFTTFEKYIKPFY